MKYNYKIIEKYDKNGREIKKLKEYVIEHESIEYCCEKIGIELGNVLTLQEGKVYTSPYPTDTSYCPFCGDKHITECIDVTKLKQLKKVVFKEKQVVEWIDMI